MYCDGILLPLWFLTVVGELYQRLAQMVMIKTVLKYQTLSQASDWLNRVHI